MSDQGSIVDQSLSAASYVPPSSTAQNIGDHESLIQEALRRLREELAAAGGAAQQSAAAQNAAPAKSPEEVAADAIAKKGAGLGLEERLNELYALVELALAKVGVSGQKGQGE